MAPRSAQLVQIGRRRIEVSNLDKILYPEDRLTKAHLLEYYLKLAPTVLAHLKGRPLSLLRFPEGIHQQSFFQKNRPEWAPEWLEHAVLGEEKKDYVIATEDAALGWLVNLAGIELHQMHSRAPHFDRPDYLVFDLDPPESFRFGDLVALALAFRQHAEGFGYHAFVKTTGRKGLHIITPIEPKADFQTAFEAAKAVAQPFVEAHPSAVTLQIKKEHRQGKVLLDIYRNRSGQTIVAAYSLRGLPRAPVSTPVQWDELESLSSPNLLNLQTVPARVASGGDPWEAIGGYAVPLHTDRIAPPARKKQLPVSKNYKTPKQLRVYSSKRDFAKTAEPPAIRLAPAGNAFVVHRHHASRLHYDLRLEQGGVLRSWAVPKGLPPRPGILRLAVNVEDHPLDYVNFEGVIPKGEYGGGTMWRFALGRHEITRQKKDGFYFRLHSPELNGEYRLHHTKDNQWLLERVDVPQVDWFRSELEPMLAVPAGKPPASADFLYEVKWDGIRALVFLDEGTVRIRGRHGTEFTAQFPELLAAEPAFRATSAIFDAEIVCLESDGKPNFRNVISRMQQSGPAAIERARAKNPAVCYVFDCLYLDGRAIINEPLARRREWVADAIKGAGAYRVSEAFEEGASLLEAVRDLGLEGIMAKQRRSVYLPGKRSESWLKIKARQTLDCVIVGYTQGQGDRRSGFGALHLAQPGQGGLRYLGKVGTGFDDHTLGAVFKELKKLTTSIRAIKETPPDRARSVWVEPKLWCEVQYASLTPDGMLREPVFLRLRPDLSA